MAQVPSSEPPNQPVNLEASTTSQINIEVSENSGLVAGSVKGSQITSIAEIHGNVHFHGNEHSFNQQAKARSKRKEIPPLLAYLADRSEQEFQLGKFVQSLYKKRASKPLIIIIHGDQYQCDLKFIERLKVRTLPQILASHFSVAAAEIVLEEHSLDWPDIEFPEADNLDEISARMCMALSKKVFRQNPYASAEQINCKFAESPDIKMIYTRLLSSVWMKSRVRVLEKMLAFWTTTWPPLQAGQELVVCISIQYQETQLEPIKKRGLAWLLSLFKRWQKARQYRRCQKINQSIRAEIAEVMRSNLQGLDTSSSVVLPELTDIKCQHAESWVYEEARDFIGDVEIQKMIDTIKRIYDKLDEPVLSMSDLSQKLICLLNSDHDQIKELT